MINPKTLTPIALALVAAKATFRPMTRDDYRAFGGAPEGALISDGHDDILIIQTPEGELSFIGCSEEGEPWEIALVTQERG